MYLATREVSYDHLPSSSRLAYPQPMPLADYQAKFRQLNVNIKNGHFSPHKVCMLLAVLDLARSGSLTENKISYGPALLERYRRFFGAVRGPQDHANAYFPFFHLRGQLRSVAGHRADSFWHLHALPGRDDELARRTTARSHRDITDLVEFASLDEELFELLQDPHQVDVLTDTMAQCWFDRGLEDLRGIARQARDVAICERAMRDRQTEVSISMSPPVRSQAFRNVVVQAYDYRCAATGLRVVLPDGTAMVEAAHIHPFAEAADDDPRNGLALTPDMHWAMDRGLIAPTPDFTWKVSRRLDDRVPDFRRLTELANRALLRPKEPRLWPKREVLEWRLAQLDAQM